MKKRSSEEYQEEKERVKKIKGGLGAGERGAEGRGKRKRWAKMERRGDKVVEGKAEDKRRRRRREKTVFGSNLPPEPLYPACSRRGGGGAEGEGRHKAV